MFISKKVFKKPLSTLNMLGNNLADVILKEFSYFSQKMGFDIPCKLSP